MEAVVELSNEWRGLLPDISDWRDDVISVFNALYLELQDVNTESRVNCFRYNYRRSHQNFIKLVDY